MPKEVEVECMNCEKTMIKTEVEEAEQSNGRIGNWHYFNCRKCHATIGIFVEHKELI